MAERLLALKTPLTAHQRSETESMMLLCYFKAKITNLRVRKVCVSCTCERDCLCFSAGKCANGKYVPTRLASFHILFFTCECDCMPMRCVVTEIWPVETIFRRKLQKFRFLVACRVLLRVRCFSNYTLPLLFRTSFHFIRSMFAQQYRELPTRLKITCHEHTARCPLNGCASVKTLCVTMNSIYILHVE